MKADVNAELCIGCDLCVQTAPLVFQMQEDKAVVIADPVPAEAEGSCKEAADSCPVNAIIAE